MSRDFAVMPADESPAAYERAADLAGRVELPLERWGEATAAMLLVPADRLELRRRERADRPGFVPNFDAALRDRSRRQPLARAVGGGVGPVLDATAGFGVDTVRFAAFGRTVTACERVPAIAALLGDALMHLDAALAERITLCVVDAREVFSEGGFEVIYIDPMFPPKRRSSALPPLKAQLLRQLAGDDVDADDLIARARAFAPRVVVKRPDDAPRDPAVNSTFGGTTVRYDVYVS